MRWVGLTVLGAMASLAGPTNIAFADDVTDQLRACRAISEAGARATCYDRVVDGLSMASQEGAPQTRAPQQPAAPIANKTPTERFGESGLASQKREQAPAAPPPEAPLDMLVATVSSIRGDGSGYGNFVLDNGQVWRQTESSTIKIQSGARVKIKSGMLGAFYMSLEDGNKSFRVRRVN